MALTDADAVRIRIALDNAAKFYADAKRAQRSVDQIGDSADRAGKKTRKFGGDLNLVQRTIALVKPAALIAAIGFLAQAAAAGSAGFIALGASMSNAAGIIAVYPAMLIAAGQAMSVFKLSTSGLLDAVGGLHDKLDPKKLAKLTPAARDFAKVLQGLKPDIITLQRSAARGFFPGATQGLKAAMPLLHTLRPIIRQTALALGDLATAMGRSLGGSVWRTGIAKIGATNVAVIGHMGRAGLHLANAFMRILVAARPLTLWVARGVERFGELADTFTAAGTNTGKLTSFFHGTQVTLSRLGRLGKAFAGALMNIVSAGKPLGDELLVSLLRATQAFEKWTGSAKGQNSIKRYFAQAKPAIYEVAKLVRDATKAFFSLANGEGLAPLIRQFRTELLPVLTRVLESTTNAFGPKIIKLITSLGRAFEPLAGTSGPLNLYVDIITKLADGFRYLQRSIPGFNEGVSTIVGVVTITRILISVIRSMINAYRAAAAVVAWFRAGNIALIATQAQLAVGLAIMRARMAALAVVGTITTLVSRARGAWIALNLVMAANPVGAVVLAIAALAAGLYVAYHRVKWFHDAVDATWAFLKTHWVLVAGIMTGGLIPAIVLITKHFGGIKSTVSGVVSSVVSRLGKIVSFITGMPGKIAGAAKGMFNGLINGANSVINRVLERLRHLVASVKSIPGQIGDTLSNLPGVKQAGGVLGAVTGAVSSVKDKVTGKKASGGPVTRTGSYLVGEKGPEIVTLAAGQYVVPNHRLRMKAPAMLGQGTTAPELMTPASRISLPGNDHQRPAVRTNDGDDRPLQAHLSNQIEIHLDGRVVAENTDDQVAWATARA